MSLSMTVHHALRWTSEVITGGDGERSNAELAALRLADPREYVAEKAAYQETLRRLDEILRPGGLRIARDGYGRPELADADAGVMRVELKVSMDQVVSDPALAAVYNSASMRPGSVMTAGRTSPPSSCSAACWKESSCLR